MTPDDLAALHAQAMEVPAPWSASDFAELLAAPGVFLASEAGTGFALGRVVLDEAELLTLAVAPAQQRQGIGSKCLLGFEDEARKRGAGRGLLEVAATNTGARRLYARTGWAKAGLRRGYYQAPNGRIDAILLAKSLFDT